MDYSKTVNLPQTDFPMKANLPQREPFFLELWEKEALYRKIQEKNAGKKKFILHDGPPYANGHIHLGTSLNKILKDIVIKYKSLSGFLAPYTPGWDCHGLPIEQQAMKELKVDKHHASRGEFRRQAAAFAKKFIDVQRGEFKRLGVLGDWENPYVTLAPHYEGVIARVFGDLVKKGYIFRQKKPVYWCPSCETALADAEVEYADHTAHSLYVMFSVNGSPKGIAEDVNASVLIWTTTPWTLPANVALAFQPAAQYVLARAQFADGRNENLIIAKKLLTAVMEKIGGSFEILNEFPGSALEGIRCTNPVNGRESMGIVADFVSLEEGTGIVHIAPGHGQEDYLAALRYNLPVLSPVDDRGVFTEEAEKFKGHKVFAANQLIIDSLAEQKALLREEKISHQYPHCWRCKHAIIFRATPQWFLNVDHEQLRSRMLASVKEVTWIPAYGENRFSGMIQVRPDWCLSRQRLWGVPLPIFYCETCGEPVLNEKIIYHIADLFAQNGSDIWFERTAAELLNGMNVSCAKCGGTTFKKEEDILDVWFDSGVSSEAVLDSGYFPALTWPADMYLEGSDQHRGWFQTSLIIGVAMKAHAPYKSVMTHGFVVDGEGKKMSKSLGNVIAPEEIITTYGADILRLWVASSDYREDVRISPEILKGLVDSYRKIRNTIRFILGNLADFSPEKEVAREKMREIDLYALSTLEDSIMQVTEAYERFEFHKAVTVINNYCSVFLSGFYLDTLKDTLYCDAADAPSRRSAQTALWRLCTALTRLCAPVLSFTAEEAWAELRKKDPRLASSVFLSDFPAATANLRFSDEQKHAWAQILLIREKAQDEFEKLRKAKKIGSNLDAHLDVHDAGHVRSHGIDSLKSVLGTWDITLYSTTDPGNPAQETEIFATPSSLKKCERCWRHVSDVDQIGVCGRCAQVLNQNYI